MEKRNERCNGCDELTKELKKARQLLAAIADHAIATATPAAAEMSRGDVPRGHYAYLRAQVETCSGILSLMGLPQVVVRQRRRVMFGSGLFSGFLRRK